MTACVSKSFLLSSSSLNGEEDLPKLVEKQGIVSILGSDIENRSKTSSLRRTLSADMSSKKWLAQNGFSTMKKNASSQHLAMTTIDSSSSSEEEGGEDYMHLAKEKGMENPRQSDIWSIIISQKAADEDASKLPPYVHPLVKRSASSLSEKSLEICTESLGSETGSDVFPSNYPPSESGEADEDKEQQHQQEEKERESEFIEEIQVVKYNYYAAKKSSSTTRSFPPPLPSLARSDGPSVHMHSHRENGRLVLKAISIPSQNLFQAQRENGRLLLTLVNNPLDESTPEQLEEGKVNDEEVFGISEEEDGDDEEINDRVEPDEEEEVEDEKGMIIETNLYRPQSKMTSEVINVHRSALTMKKLMVTENRNPAWPNSKFSKAFNSTMELEPVARVDDDQKDHSSMAHSLPPLPRKEGHLPAPPAAAAVPANTYNSYDYFWRAKPTVASIINQPPTTHHSSLPFKNNSNKAYEQKDLVLLRGNKADSLVSMLRSCKEPRRSLLSWEPHCIATS